MGSSCEIPKRRSALGAVLINLFIQFIQTEKMVQGDVVLNPLRVINGWLKNCRMSV